MSKKATFIDNDENETFFSCLYQMRNKNYTEMKKKKNTPRTSSHVTFYHYLQITVCTQGRSTIDSSKKVCPTSKYKIRAEINPFLVNIY